MVCVCVIDKSLIDKRSGSRLGWREREMAVTGGERIGRNLLMMLYEVKSSPILPLTLSFSMFSLLSQPAANGGRLLTSSQRRESISAERDAMASQPADRPDRECTRLTAPFLQQVTTTCSIYLSIYIYIVYTSFVQTSHNQNEALYYHDIQK